MHPPETPQKSWNNDSALQRVFNTMRVLKGDTDQLRTPFLLSTHIPSGLINNFPNLKMGRNLNLKTFLLHRFKIKNLRKE